MLVATSPLSAALIAAPQAGALRAAAPEFSYDDAVAALERQSARSLDIHGGQPKTAATAGRAPSDAAAGAQPGNAAASEKGATGPKAQPAGQGTAAQNSGPATNPSQPAANVAAAITIPAPIATAPPPAAPSPPPASGATPARDGAVRLKSETPPSPALVRAPASAVKQFAEILAQRLDNASQFDLRLDPPALGSVEGRLTLSDDGQAMLALSFDNQSAFDLFRRDDAALRFALADAGFDLAGRNLQFSFRESPRAAAHSTAEPAPAFVTPAPLHRGAVDIRA